VLLAILRRRLRQCNRFAGHDRRDVVFRQRFVEFRHGGFNEGVELRQFIRELVLQLAKIFLLLNRRRGVGAIDAAK